MGAAAGQARVGGNAPIGLAVRPLEYEKGGVAFDSEAFDQTTGAGAIDRCEAGVAVELPTGGGLAEHRMQLLAMRAPRRPKLDQPRHLFVGGQHLAEVGDVEDLRPPTWARM